MYCGKKEAAYLQIKKDYFTLEESDTVSQFPPLRENLPLPIRNRISSGVSFGPLAKGVYLHRAKPKEINSSQDILVLFILVT